VRADRRHRARRERLCVSSTRHKRFKAENRAELFDEINSLYALTRRHYRYSVSSAGAAA
jgi:hypothetical protein